MVSVFALLLSAWLPILLLWPGFYLAVLVNTSLVLALHHRSLCGLLGGPSAFVMHTAWALGFFWGLIFVQEPPWRPEAAAPLWLDSPIGR